MQNSEKAAFYAIKSVTGQVETKESHARHGALQSLYNAKRRKV